MKVISVLSLIILPLLLTGLACNSNGPIAPGGGDAPPAWIEAAGIVSVVSGDSEVTVYWGEAIDLQDSPVEYLVYKDEDDSPWDQPPVVCPDNGPYVFTNLAGGVTYRFGVRCRDSAKPPHVDGNTKVLGAMLRDVIPPVWDGAVGVVTLVPWGNEVTVYWGTATDAKSPPVEYLVYEDKDSNPWDQEPVVRDTNDPYTFSVLQNDVQYWFGVRCRDSAGPRNVDANDVVLSATPKVHEWWARTWGGTGSVKASDVALDKAGSVYVTGKTDGTIDFDPGAGSAELTTTGAYLSKYDLQGSFQWVQNWGPPPLTYDWNPDAFEVNSVAADSQGTYLCGSWMGYTDLDPGTAVHLLDPAYYGPMTAEPGWWISKLDNSGNFEWAKSEVGVRIEAAYWRTIDEYWGRSVVIDPLGNVWFAFSSVNVFNFYGGGVDYANTFANLAGYSSFGDSLGSGKIGGDHNYSYGFEFASGCAVSKSGYKCLLGDGAGVIDEYTPDSHEERFGFLGIWNNIPHDFIAYVKWGTGATEVSTGSVAFDSADCAFVTGNFKGAGTFGPASLVSNGDSDCYLIKVFPDGSIKLAVSWGGSDVDSAIDLAVNDIDDIIVVGGFSGTVDFDPGAGVHQITASGSQDLFILQLDPNCNFIQVVTLGGNGSVSAKGIACDEDGSLYITGDFTGSIDFDPSSVEDIHAAQGETDSFLIRLLG